MSTERDYRREVGRAIEALDRELVRAAEFLATRLGVAVPQPLRPAEAEQLSAVLREQLAVLPAEQRRLILIQRAPVLAGLAKALARLSRLRDETSGRIGRLKRHSAAVVAYARRNSPRAIH